MTGAAEGLQEAAFLSDDYEQSVTLLKQADGLYKVGGYPDRGLSLMKKFAQALLDKETEESTRKAMAIYEHQLIA